MLSRHTTLALQLKVQQEALRQEDLYMELDEARSTDRRLGPWEASI